MPDDSSRPRAAGAGSAAQDRMEVARLDREYQAAVKHNDAATLDRIMHPDFALVLSTGAVVTRDEILAEARSGEVVFERQDEDPGSQVVRVWGDTAVVTACLWIKGAERGQPFERRLWFSDTYVRTPRGWLYAFGQAAGHLPDS